MPFDAITISAVRHELSQKIVGGRVQGVVVAGPLTVSLQIYRAGVGRTNLLVSAHPQYARLLLMPKAPSRDPQQQPPLLLLLRKYVRGGIILNVSQPPHERVLGLSIAKRIGSGKHQEYHSDPYFSADSPTQDDEEEEEAGPEVPVTTVELVIELMGKLSNIILVDDDGAIIDSIKRVPASVNRYRTTLPHARYTAPPPQSKKDPGRATPNIASMELQKAIDKDPRATAWNALVGAFAGVSPTLAREAVFRALGNSTVPAADIGYNPLVLGNILQELNSLLGLDETAAWEPTLAWSSGPEAERRALDFAPYPLTHLEANGGELERFGSISEAAARYFTAQQELGGHSALRAQVGAALEEIVSRDRRRLDALRDQLARSEASEELRRKGEFLLSYMHTLKPGQRTLVVPDENLTIELDLDLTPVENAQAFFKEYHKARAAQEGIPAMVEQAELRMAFLDELATSLDMASNYDEIRAVQAELEYARHSDVRKTTNEQERGQGPGESKPAAKGKGRKKEEKLPQPLRLQTSRGTQVLVGRTARQNDLLTFRLAAPSDLWFHARGVPGSHVILRSNGVVAPDEADVQEAAALAAGYSKLREESQVDVIYTEKRHVRKIPNSPPGLVTYKNDQSVRVVPRRPR